MRNKYSIGAVCFGKVADNPQGFEYLPVLGQDRVDMLKRLYLGLLDSDLILLAYDGGGFFRINADEVNWDTSDIPRKCERERIAAER